MSRQEIREATLQQNTHLLVVISGANTIFVSIFHFWLVSIVGKLNGLRGKKTISASHCCPNVRCLSGCKLMSRAVCQKKWSPLGTYIGCQLMVASHCACMASCPLNISQMTVARAFGNVDGGVGEVDWVEDWLDVIQLATQSD